MAEILTIQVVQQSEGGYRVEFSVITRAREDGLNIAIRLIRNLPARYALQEAAELVRTNGLRWIIPGRETWSIDFSALQAWVIAEGGSAKMERYEWLRGRLSLRPAIDHLNESVVREDGRSGIDTRSMVVFTVFKEEYLVDSPNRIFLSHKGVDKPMVERYYRVLQELGFQPWLDEEDMNAGSELHRSIQQGFKESCAAVFFITPNFKDEKYLRSEINYAIQEKTEKEERFSIITLVLTDTSGKAGEVPESLRKAGYIWKKASTELEGLRYIIRGLPVRAGPIEWRTHTAEVAKPEPASAATARTKPDSNEKTGLDSEQMSMLAYAVRRYGEFTVAELIEFCDMDELEAEVTLNQLCEMNLVDRSWTSDGNLYRVTDAGKAEAVRLKLHK